jgi:MOSC domain-containing protein
MGVVASLWRFPVKSMRGEPLAHAELTKHGVLGDRAFAIIDVQTGKVASAKSVKRFPDLLACQAAFVYAPEAGRELPPVRITLPDGNSVTSESSDADRVLSAHFRRDVTLASVAPEDFTIDHYHPDIPDVDPDGHRDTVVEHTLGSAYFAEHGLRSPVPVGALFDGFPLSVLTTATLAQLSAIRPESRFDPRRFRMNVIVDVEGAGFPEDRWLGHEVAIGDSVRIRIAVPDGRCVMTTLAQEDLPADIEILRTLTNHHRLPGGSGKPYPCAGVYAIVETAGTMNVGDHVVLC